MPEKTYSEQRQAVWFRSAVELRKIAAAVLDDVLTEAELTGRTASWAKLVAAVTARQATEAETKGFEETVVYDGRVTRALYKSRDDYAKAIQRFEDRLRKYGVDPATVQTTA